MRRTTHRLIVLVAAALVMGCSPEAPTPPPAEATDAALSLTPAPTKRGMRSPIKKPNKPPGPGGGMPKASSVPVNSDL
jgi:hypothetical protein